MIPWLTSRGPTQVVDVHHALKSKNGEILDETKQDDANSDFHIFKSGSSKIEISSETMWQMGPILDSPAASFTKGICNSSASQRVRR